MGLFIKDMQKPKSCAECELWSLCFYPKAPKEIDDRVMPDCPLEEIDLVRCGECKYIYTDEGVTLCGVWGKYTFKDGFCYQGERRNDERITE